MSDARPGDSMPGQCKGLTFDLHLTQSLEGGSPSAELGAFGKVESGERRVEREGAVPLPNQCKRLTFDSRLTIDFGGFLRGEGVAIERSALLLPRADPSDATGNPGIDSAMPSRGRLDPAFSSTLGFFV